jgi:hypothetical protein
MVESSLLIAPALKRWRHWLKEGIWKEFSLVAYTRRRLMTFNNVR